MCMSSGRASLQLRLFNGPHCRGVALVGVREPRVQKPCVRETSRARRTLRVLRFCVARGTVGSAAVPATLLLLFFSFFFSGEIREKLLNSEHGILGLCVNTGCTRLEVTDWHS
ncbi:hypothetical protein PGIGA_G00123630 [Pangasianodon gigas]|uniref:Uncharacterized protein n=1 Tax=Pangasianodon gigas TaxID=30993 RepID=A0ACC5XH60_PANGG|nr:hypothetical protein [Pangasianodon gigas]